MTKSLETMRPINYTSNGPDQHNRLQAAARRVKMDNRLTIYLPNELRQRAQRLADSEQRSLSQVIRMAIEAWIDKALATEQANG
jgi:predicted DNA-binding protein